MNVSIRLDNEKQSVCIEFPTRIVSTNVGQLKDRIFENLPTEDNISANTCELIFDQTIMIDSLGLNLLVSIIEWADTHQLKIESKIRHDIIFKTLDSVWLTQKMKVHRIDSHE